MGYRTKAIRAAAVAAILPAACAAPPPAPPAGPPETAAAEERPREGPWRVECFQDEELVFEHDRIYRVWQARARPPHWAWETDDGLRFRGRMGADLTCVWRRL